MRRRWLYGASFLILLAAAAGGLLYASRGEPLSLKGCQIADRPPRIRPDYTGITVPPNMAPLNFIVEEPGTLYHVEVHSSRGEPVPVTSRGPKIGIPIRPWHRLLEANRGEPLCFDVYVRSESGEWRRFQTVTNTIAREEIDPYLVYRRMNSVFTMWQKVGLYQRRLETFEESVVVDSEMLDVGCVNCHAFLEGRPDRMLLHMRHAPEGYGSGMVLIEDGESAKVDMRTERSLGLAAFSSWHPSGRAIAFSMDRIAQFFHGSAAEVREVVDLDSDVAVYLLDSRTVTSTAAIAAPDALETWPAWDADGRYLYFCSAPVLWEDRYTAPPENCEKVRYDLKRISYDLSTGAWGEPETVLSAEQTGQSITQPRVSPDGRFLLFCMCDRSVFPSFRDSSDLYMLDLGTGKHRSLACNSPQAESWHCWSSNGRWIAFSSKRDDGMFIRAWFSYIDEDGRARKPFVLPQEDPAFYDSCIQLFQVPELARGPLPLAGERLASRMRSEPWLTVGGPVTGATPASAGESGTSRLPISGRE